MRYPSRLCLLACRRLSSLSPPSPPRFPFFARSGDADNVGWCLVRSSRSSCRREVRLVASACLMFTAVCLDASPRYRRSCLAACRLPLRASARASTPPRSVIDVGAAAVPWRLASRPASSTRRTGRYDGAVDVLVFACLPLGSSSHPCGSASDGDGLGDCLVKLTPCLFPSHGHHLCRLLPIRFPRRPAASLRLPSPITRHGGRGGCLLASAACLSFDSFAIAVRCALRAICAGSVEDGVGGCLACLGVVLCILSMGDVVARRCVSCL